MTNQIRRKNIGSQDWSLSLNSSLSAIKKNIAPVVKINGQPFLEFTEHLPIIRGGVFCGTSYYVGLCGELDTIFSGVKDMNEKLDPLTGFYNRLTVELLVEGVACRLTGTFYILECKGLYKIGISNNYVSRRARYRTENPFPLNEIFAEEIHGYQRVESKIKELFKHKHYRGEWYVFNDRDLEFIGNALHNIIKY
jgi:hypothetical protein